MSRWSNTNIHRRPCGARVQEAFGNGGQVLPFCNNAENYGFFCMEFLDIVR